MSPRKDRPRLDVRAFLDNSAAPLLSLGVLVVVGVLLVVAYRDAGRSPRFQVDPRTVQVASAPDWFSDRLAERLAVQLGSSLGPPVSLLDEEGLERWREDLLVASPWVASVESVEGRFPAQAQVRLRVKRPVLELPGEVLVAADGQHLDRGRMDTYPPPLRLEGFQTEEDVRECAASVADISPWREELEQAGVLLERVHRDSLGRVRFKTDADVEIEWGRSTASSEFAAVDLPPLARIRHLMTVLERRPGLVGVSRVIVWKDQPEVVVPPAAGLLPEGG